MKNPPSITGGISSNAYSVIDMDKIIDNRRYSTKANLLRVTARILRFTKRARRHPGQYSSAELNANELREAERLLIRSIQATAFAEEIQSNRSNPLVNQLQM